MFNKKPDYQQTLEWADAPNEKVLIAWDIKKIIHNWVKPTIVFVLFTSAIGIPFFILLFYFSPAESKIPIIWTIVACYTFLLGLICLEVRRKNQLVYHLTDKGLEFHQWRIYPDFLFSWSKGMLVLMGVLALLIGLFSKTGFFAIIGPVAIVASLFIKVTTPEYKRAMVNHMHRGAFWSNITKIQHDAKKHLLRLNYDGEVSEEEIQKQLSRPGVIAVCTSGEYDIFMTKDNEQQVLAVLKKCLPNLTIEEAILELPDNDS